ncbi:Hypothetical predicted protein [Cloeon dipterum]|uniref:Uncharacterized protein n=1 Tax=Cloeon dipterum TaxID=197152 RepID=A0A8S1D2Y8_9INSE|nr:Hypothetical predicted protein [Cloeon dipterum]
MGKKTKRKTRWRSLPIDASSQNEDDGDEIEENGGSESPAQHNGYRKYRPNGYSKYHGGHHYNRYSASQPASQQGSEKKLFNEDEYTKITTPRQDVLFKKGYLGRRRATPLVSSSNGVDDNAANDNGECPDNQSEASSETVTSQEQQPQLVYTNGYIDPQGGPVFYLNGAYEVYDPYTGAYTSFMVPAGFPPQGGGVLTAVPCQPLPLQPLEWFSPRATPDGWCFVPPQCQQAPIPNGSLASRKKRYSTDSQNCSPNSSESTGPPGSPQHEEEEEEEEELDGIDPSAYQQPPPYVYPGYMFGAAVYNVNGATVQPLPPASNGTGVSSNGSVACTNGHSSEAGQTQTNGHHPAVNGHGNQPAEQPVNNLSTATSQSSKKRKKKRRRKRRTRGEKAGTDEGSEETSSEEGADEKEHNKEATNGPKEPDKMSSSSPGLGGPSESCSELSPASSALTSSHNSQDEMSTEPKPARVEAEPQNTVVVKQEEETTVDDGEEEAVVTAAMVITPRSQAETIQQLIKEAVEEPVLEAVVAPEPVVCEKKPGKIARKGSRKARAPPAPSPTPNKASSEESLSEVGSPSPVPPPRRRPKSRQHRPPTPLPLSGDEDSVAADLSEQIIVCEAVTVVDATPAEIPEPETAVEPSKRPITEAVTEWLHATNPPLSLDSDIEEEDDLGDSDAGSKNALGNPLPAPSSSVPDGTAGTRVASLGIAGPDSCSCSDPEWDASWDGGGGGGGGTAGGGGTGVVRLTGEGWLDVHQLTDSGIESGDEPPPAKFVRHLPDQEPLPCAGAVCCSIQ